MSILLCLGNYCIVFMLIQRNLQLKCCLSKYKLLIMDSYHIDLCILSMDSYNMANSFSIPVHIYCLWTRTTWQIHSRSLYMYIVYGLVQHGKFILDSCTCILSINSYNIANSFWIPVQVYCLWTHTIC